MSQSGGAPSRIEFNGTVSGSDAVKHRVEFYVDDDDQQTWFPVSPEHAREWARYGGRRMRLTLEILDGPEPELKEIGFGRP